jgi:hypothetical protein
MEVEVTELAWLLRPHIAEQFVAAEVPETPEREAPGARAPLEEGITASTTAVESEPRYREVHIEIEGWENWNDLLRYVIKPLSDQGFAPCVRVTIDASSVTGVPAKLLRDQIEVSLQQLGIHHTLDTKPA